MEVVELSPIANKVPLNFRCLLMGCSESGKSSFISRLIKNKSTIFQEPYEKFLYCSPNLGGSALSSRHDLDYKKCLEEWAAPTQIQFYNYIMSEDELMEITDSTAGRTLLICDDFSLEFFQTPLCYSLFTRLSSHRKLDSCISLHQGCASRTSGKWFSAISQNCNYLVLFRNIANRAAIGEISKRVYPYSNNFLQRCLEKATELLGVYGYICVDASLQNPLNNSHGVRTNIFQEYGLPVILFKNPNMSHGK